LTGNYEELLEKIKADGIRWDETKNDECSEAEKYVMLDSCEKAY